MGQQEVYDFLTKNPDQWYTSKQISEQLIVSIGSVTMSLKKLRKTNIIKYRNTGKRNTFQYMVQSEPAKLTERKTTLMEEMHEPIRMKVKIKPKIVHQHTYMGGQTFYGVIRPKEEVDAMERQKQEAVVKAKRIEDRKIKKVAVKRVSIKRTKKQAKKKLVRKAKPVKKAKRKLVRKR